MNKKKRIILMISAIIIILSSIGFLKLKKVLKNDSMSNIETYTIPSTEKVFVNGIISPKKTKNIYLDLTKGELYEIHVINNQSVQQGDPLITYRNNQIDDQIEQVRNQLQLAESQKKQLSKESNGNNTNSNIEIEINQYNKQIKNLKNKKFQVVRAPISGKVVLNESNSDVSPYIVIKSNEMYINGKVNEKDHAKIKYGQFANVKIIANDKKCTGKITNISNDPIASIGEIANSESNELSSGNNMSYYKLDINLDSQDNVVDGYHIQASIDLGDDEIKIPQSCVLEEGNTYYVFKKIDNKLSKQKIEYSSHNDDKDKVIITEGLKKSDQIVLNPGSDLREGASFE